MRLAPLLAVTFLAAAIVTCGSPDARATTSKGDPPRCARTFVIAITSSRPTPGLWDCLTNDYQSRLHSQGDGVFTLRVPLWSGFRYLGLDSDIAMFDLTINADVEQSVYRPPVSHVILALYLAADGRVDRARTATPT